MKLTGEVVLVHGEQELFERAAHLMATAEEMTCAAHDLFTWAPARPRQEIGKAVARHGHAGKRIRKLFRPGVLFDPSSAQHLREVSRLGAQVRITPAEINETILIDRRVAILAGDLKHGVRGYSVIDRPEVVQGVASLFEAAWLAATDLAVYDARHAELCVLAPRILELLASGCKDETAARTLELGLRTYRRRVAELMAALGATSRFQAGARARDLGII
ncbi:response regulator transcription factor [Amycolatopsis nigrescens]|uniref:response regulator transcription factor n=1 Tax=Amycolatopsis nigrescens TaxID=381445 RepID=UPI000368067B|nr:response regulator transcription factor [Amycolatopsis nigrescens]